MPRIFNRVSEPKNIPERTKKTKSALELFLKDISKEINNYCPIIPFPTYTPFLNTLISLSNPNSS